MFNTVALGEVEQLTAQLPPPQRLKLVASICEQLSAVATEDESEQVSQVRLQLAEELLAECYEIDDDSKGDFDAAQDIRQIREERANRLSFRF